jgi:hypothetical protein
VKRNEGHEGASLEKKGPVPEEMTNVAAHPEDFNGATREEAIGATEDRSRDRHLAVRLHRPTKKRSQGNGGSRQKLATTLGRLTHHAIPALYRSRGHK